MYVALLIVHGLMAVALLGAVTHQTVNAWMPVHKPAQSFTGRFRVLTVRTEAELAALKAKAQ